MLNKVFISRSLFISLTVSAAFVQANESLQSEGSYAHFGNEALPEYIKENNDPIDLTAVPLGQLPCDDISGEGVENFLKTGRHPKKWSSGKFTVRANKPIIKKNLRYIDGSPAHLTVTSFKENCWAAMVRAGGASKPQTKKIVEQAVEEKTRTLDEQVQYLQDRLESLEARVKELESR